MAAITGKTDKEQADLAKTLQDTPTVGYIWTGASLGYTLKYAHRQTLPDGSEQVVVVTDRPLGSWERTGPWKASTGSAEADRPITVIELHLNKSWRWPGKDVAVHAVCRRRKDQGARDSSTTPPAPILLKDVKHKPAPRES